MGGWDIECTVDVRHNEQGMLSSRPGNKKNDLLHGEKAETKGFLNRQRRIPKLSGSVCVSAVESFTMGEDEYSSCYIFSSHSHLLTSNKWRAEKEGKWPRTGDELWRKGTDRKQVTNYEETGGKLWRKEVTSNRWRAMTREITSNRWWAMKKGKWPQTGDELWKKRSDLKNRWQAKKNWNWPQTGDEL